MTENSVESAPKRLNEANYADVLTETIEYLRDSNASLAESLASVQQMFAFEDRGWDKWWSSGWSDEVEGLTLDELHEISPIIREQMVGNPIIKRGAQLRISYIWSKGIEIPGVVVDGSAKPGRKSNLEAFYRKPANQDALFSVSAHEELERAAYSDGTVFLLGNNTTKELRSIPLKEITGVFVNPDYADEVWAYKRSWTSYATNEKGEPKSRWYYTDRHTGPKKSRIGGPAAQGGVPVDKGYTMIAQPFNRQIGWPLGIPDAIAVIAWAKVYSEFLKYGKVMSEALAKFAFKVTADSQAGATNIGARVSTSKGSGKTAVTGGGNDLVPLSSAGRGYDFASGRPLAAQIATGLEVSIVHLLADPGAAGSSYGSASNLDMPTKRAMVARQRSWEAFFERVLKWAVGEDIKTTFPDLDDPDPYRQVQVDALVWGTGLVHEDEARPKLLEHAGMASKHETPPDGVMLPNNTKALEASAKATAAGTPAPASAANGGDMAPTQGSSPKFGGGGSNDAKGNDIRTDTLSNSMAVESMMERLAELIQRMENLGNS